MKPPPWHDKRGPSACRSSHAIGLLLVGAVPPPITWQSHPLPSSHGGDQGGLQRHPGGDRAGWGTSPPLPAPCQAVDLGLHCLPCSVGKEIWKGPWVMWGYPRVVPTPSVGAGGGFSQVGSRLHPVPALHLSNTHSSGLRERWAGSGSQKAAGPWWSQRPPHPSSLSASAGSPAVLGSGAERTAGRSRAARDRQEASWR